MLDKAAVLRLLAGQREAGKTATPGAFQSRDKASPAGAVTSGATLSQTFHPGAVLFWGTRDGLGELEVAVLI